MTKKDDLKALLAAKRPAITNSMAGDREEQKARQILAALVAKLGGLPDTVELADRALIGDRFDEIAAHTVRGGVSIHAVVYFRGDRFAAAGAGESTKYIYPALRDRVDLPSVPKSWTKPKDRHPYAKSREILESILAARKA